MGVEKNMDENKNSKEDLISLRNYTLGVVAFATAVSTILIQVLHFRTEPTIACTLAFSCMMLLIVYLIGRAERRNQKILENHITGSDNKFGCFEKKLNSIDEVLTSIQASTLRIELNNMIYRHPENHDTIIKMAERYFCELGQNWVMVDVFSNWIDNENKSGREVHIPAELVKTIGSKRK